MPQEEGCLVYFYSSTYTVGASVFGQPMCVVDTWLIGLAQQARVAGS